MVVTLLQIFAYFRLCSSQTRNPWLFSAGKVCVPYVSPCSTGRKMSCCDRLQVCCHPPVVRLGCLCCVLSEHLPRQKQLFLTFPSGDDVLGVISQKKCSLCTRSTQNAFNPESSAAAFSHTYFLFIHQSYSKIYHKSIKHIYNM